jgi:hypothetical protein
MPRSGPGSASQREPSVAFTDADSGFQNPLYCHSVVPSCSQVHNLAFRFHEAPLRVSTLSPEGWANAGLLMEAVELRAMMGAFHVSE